MSPPHITLLYSKTSYRLASEATLSRGIELALGLGMLEQQGDNSDAARQERFYLPRLRSIAEEDETLPIEAFSGFYRPEANYFAGYLVGPNVHRYLGVIRQVVEAAVGQALAGLELNQISEREDEADSILNILDGNLVMD